MPSRTGQVGVAAVVLVARARAGRDDEGLMARVVKNDVAARLGRADVIDAAQEVVRVYVAGVARAPGRDVGPAAGDEKAVVLAAERRERVARRLADVSHELLQLGTVLQVGRRRPAAGLGAGRRRPEGLDQRHGVAVDPLGVGGFELSHPHRRGAEVQGLQGPKPRLPVLCTPLVCSE